VLLLIRFQAAPPAGRGVVVVRAGVCDHARTLKVVGQVGIARIVESKLKHPHARHVEVIPESFDIRGNVAEIFSKDLVE